MAVRVTPVADADASHPEASARAGATAAAAQGGDEASRGVRVQRAESALLPRHVSAACRVVQRRRDVPRGAGAQSLRRTMRVTLSSHKQV